MSSSLTCLLGRVVPPASLFPSAPLGSPGPRVRQRHLSRALALWDQGCEVLTVLNQSRAEAGQEPAPGTEGKRGSDAWAGPAASWLQTPHPRLLTHCLGCTPRCCLDQVPRSWSLGLRCGASSTWALGGRMGPLEFGKASSDLYSSWSVLTAWPQESVCPEINAPASGLPRC